MIPVPAEIAQTFALEYAVVSKGVTYTELQARRPKVKDLRTLARGDDKDPVGSYNAFLAQICTVPPEAINELDLADYNAIQDWARDFLPKSGEPTS